MGKLFGIICIVGLIWAGLEVYQKGTDGAFGGFLDDIGFNTKPIVSLDGTGRVTERAEKKLRDAYERGYDRADEVD